MPSDARPSRAVFGEGLRTLRERRGLTQGQVAERVRDLGWRASQVTITKAEAGTYGLELEHVVLLCLVLGDATPADFVLGSKPVALSPTFDLRADLFRELLRGWRWPSEEYWKAAHEAAFAFARRAGSHSEQEIEAVWPKGKPKRGYPGYEGGARWGDVLDAEQESARDTEQAVAKQLGLTPFQVALLSRRLWGKGLSERRDELAPTDAGPTARGHVTRRLIRELREALGHPRSTE